MYVCIYMHIIPSDVPCHWPEIEVEKENKRLGRGKHHCLALYLLYCSHSLCCDCILCHKLNKKMITKKYFNVKM